METITEENIINVRINNNESYLKKLVLSASDLLSFSQNLSKEEFAKKVENVGEDLESLEYHVIKSLTKLKNTERDKNYYKKQVKQKKDEAEVITGEIIKLGEDLKLALKKKNLKQKYNQIAKNVIQLKDQKEMEDLIHLRKRRVEEIQQTYDQKKEELDLKQKKIEIALLSISEFFEDEKMDNEENGKDDKEDE